jgi:restriction system protein
MDALGYKHIRYTGASNDDGADIFARKDDRTVVVQTKRYSSSVGKVAIQEAVGAREAYRQDVAIVVTNSYFTKPAIEFAKRVDCLLVDRDDLARWATDSRR